MAVFKKSKVHLGHWFEKQQQWPCTVFSTQELFFQFMICNMQLQETLAKLRKGLILKFHFHLYLLPDGLLGSFQQANLLPKLTQCPLGQLLPDFNAILCHGYKKQ